VASKSCGHRDAARFARLERKKEHAALAVASGTAWFIGGGPATLGVAITYLELKWLANEYWGAVIGIDAAWLRGSFEHMQRSAETIIRHSGAMQRAHDLMVAEKDPEKAAALQKAEHIGGAELQYYLDLFLETCTSGSVRAVAPGRLADPPRQVRAAYALP
jgi:hypothetical protein